jgi:hypothetical protein
MPNGVYPVPRLHREPGPHLSFRLLARTWWRRRRLDDRLAGGADPASSPELALRALRICSQRRRERLARTLERVMSDARQPPPLMRAQVPLRRRAILECMEDLQALVGRLRDGHAVDPQGVVLIERLLTDGGGPLYHDRSHPLRYTVRSARLALDPLGLEASDLPTAA